MHMREENINDIETISKIHYAAFKDHPMHPPGTEPVEHLIVERLRASNDLSLSLLLEEDGEALGHIAFSPAVVGDTTSGWYLLGPVGVLPQHQKKGIGSALIREGLQRLQAAGALGVALVGNPQFYKHFGFTTMPGVLYPGVPEQYVLMLPFTPSAPGGEIIPHEALKVSGA